MASEHTLTLTDGDFEQTVLQSDKPVLVDFWAQWCGPCRMIAPAVGELAEEYNGRVAVGKLNIDENPDTPQKYGVRSIPTLLLFKDGKVVKILGGRVQVVCGRSRSLWFGLLQKINVLNFF